MLYIVPIVLVVWAAWIVVCDGALQTVWLLAAGVALVFQIVHQFWSYKERHWHG
jgi:hypothetical protein